MLQHEGAQPSRAHSPPHPSTTTRALPHHTPACTHLQALWPRLTGLRWMHSASAGLEHLLFPELVASPVMLSNARGVYSHSLAEYTLTCCSWFAKDFPRCGNREWQGEGKGAACFLL